MDAPRWDPFPIPGASMRPVACGHVHHLGLIPEAVMFQVLIRGDHDEKGQGLAEYALILGLIAVVAIAALVFMGTTISALLSQIGATL